MADTFRPHEVARVKSGKYAGLVGTVTEARPASVRVLIEGVRDDKEVRAHVWMKPSQLERNHGEG